jgi:hypothetical protein
MTAPTRGEMQKPQLSRPYRFEVGLGVVCLVIFIGLLIRLFIRDFDVPRTPSRQATCSSHMKTLALALQNYHTSNGAFPPAYVADKDGKPLYSWRVLILPYIEEPILYGQFHLDEPWDSAHNLKLAESMPRTFRCPTSKISSTSTVTSYVGVAGEDTMWRGTTSLRESDFTDGTANTIALMDWAQSDVVWTEPRDVSAEQLLQWWQRSTVSPGDSHHGDGVMAVFANVRSSYLERKSIDSDGLRALLTPAGKDEIPDELKSQR